MLLSPAVGGTDCTALLRNSSCVVCGKLESIHVLKMPQLPKSVLLWARVPRAWQTGRVCRRGVPAPSWVRRVGSLSVCLWVQRSLSTSPDTRERCRDLEEGSCLGPRRGPSGAGGVGRGCSVSGDGLGPGGSLRGTESTQSQGPGFSPSVLICYETLGK